MKKTFKNKRFTFIYPDFGYYLRNGKEYAEKGGWYHEGIAQLSAIVESKGWEVNLIHTTMPLGKKELQAKIKEQDPDIIGISVRTGVRKYGKKMAKWLKPLNKFILIGSYHPTLWPDEVIAWDGVDAICIGEGENPVSDLLDRINNGDPVEETGSLWVKLPNGEIFKNKGLPVAADLDALPFPKFDIFDFDKFIASQIKTAIIVLTRGCPYNCTYCWNNKARQICVNKKDYVRFRSPENCMKYIKEVKKVYPKLRSFRFQDDLWPFYNDWFPNFSNLYEKQINKPFECHLRANLLTVEILTRLKEIGCHGIYMGVESGNDEIRNKVLKRNMSKEQLITAFKTSKKLGIRTHAYNIVGLPHENMRKVLDTVKLNARLEPTDMFFPIYYPYGGTELDDISIRNGFYDPKKPLDPYVNIEMPDFKRNQIRFASLYSKTFVRLYQRVFKLPKKPSKFLENILDRLWLFKGWPFPILIAWINFKRRTEAKIKEFIKTHFFGMYLALKK